VYLTTEPILGLRLHPGNLEICEVLTAVYLTYEAKNKSLNNGNQISTLIVVLNIKQKKTRLKIF
jgi:hypothetical protein